MNTYDTGERFDMKMVRKDHFFNFNVQSAFKTLLLFGKVLGHKGWCECYVIVKAIDQLFANQ